MRKKDNVVYEAAKGAAKNVIVSLQKELQRILDFWSNRNEEWRTKIVWFNPKKYGEYNGFYGNEPGLYLLLDEKAKIWLPRTSVEFKTFITLIKQLYLKNDESINISIPNIEIWLDKEENVQLKLYTNLQNRMNEEEYSFVKTIAEEILEMISGLESCKQFEYCEGYNCSNSDPTAPTAEAPNFYVGLKTSYNMWDVN